MSPPTPERSDEQLIELARSGDRAALGALLERHYPRVLLLCRRLCGNRHDAEDCAQNALIAISTNLPRFDGRSAFSTWSYRVTTNACLDELRRRQRRPDLGVAGDTAAAADLDAIGDEGPEAAALRSEQRGQLQTALDSLPAQFREPVVLRDVAGLDYAEIAEALGIAPGTVRSRISRGRARLAEMLATGNQHSVRGVEPLDTP